ncbi:PREDICTED: uncharacterized protein LOC18608112 [Theobroma cacao]|uniref:Uncharacterized protein LOC18608112 n=1 Tax=Theobroma cacao TaxID=3641 RepID=A0AB32VIA4_THECC|nr:PREDICTED: uncharacterized protein LOC18608112 [Theobroma cacao]
MRSKGRKAKKQSKLMKIVCSPIRLLSKARAFYVKNIEECAGGVGRGGGVVCPAPPAASRLHKSFSVNSSKASDDEEFRQLLRAASKRGIDSKVQSSGMKRTTAGSGGMGMRSYSVGIGKIGRIDEDKPCSFEEEEIDAMLYPRSRSYAARRNVVVYR